MQRNKTKRNYLTHKKFQLGHALIIAALQIPCILLTGMSLSWFYLIYLDSRLTAACNPGIFWVMALICLALSGAVIYFSIRLTHAVAGPVQKTGAVLRQMAEGHLPEEKITFRKRDAFKFLADDLNLLSEALRKNRKEEL
jgi:methyl-accepting chemotaxis protein